MTTLFVIFPTYPISYNCDIYQVRPPAQQDPRLPPAHRTFNAGDRWALRRVKQLTLTFQISSYYSYSCESTSHRHHRDISDSVYQQNRLQGEYFGILRRLGIYVNQPDNYFYQGGSKTGMGYDEEQYSLPRWQDLSVSRQTVYDNTFQKVAMVVLN